MSTSQPSVRRTTRNNLPARSYREMEEDESDAADDDVDAEQLAATDDPAFDDADEAVDIPSRPRGRKRRSDESAPAAPTTEDEAVDDEEADPRRKRAKQTRKGKSAPRAAPEVDGELLANGAEGEEEEGDDDAFTAEDRLVEGGEETREYTLEELVDDSDIRLEAVTDEVRALDAMEERRRASGTKEPEAGVIIRVKLTNFMIHQKFTIEFNPHVTFIHGHNGSGKSAVLVALQCVFGARAMDTNRGSTVAQLIRVGAKNREAEVEVHFHNSHELPWQPATLGGKEFTSTLPPIIRLRRQWRSRADGGVVSSVGMSRYDLWWDEAWHKVRADDVQQLCLYFNIQVSNPCVILTQERSKKFLAQGDAAHKYKFFKEATQLDKLKLKHDEGLKRVQLMDEEIKGGRQSLSRMEKERDALQEWVTRKQAKDEAQKQLDEVRALEAWARWKERRDERDRQQLSVAGMEEQTRKLQEELNSLQLDHGQFEEEKRRRNEEVHRRMADLDAASKAREEAASKADTQKAKARQAVNRVDALTKKRDRGQKELERKVAEIAKVRREMEEQNASAEQERNRKVAELEEEHKRIQGVKDSLLQAHNERRQQLNGIDGMVRKCQQEEQASAERVREVEKQLQNLRVAQQRGGSRFGARTADIRAAVLRRQSSFSALPVGPLGDFIQIGKADELFLTAIETCITKAGLCAYVVNNTRDRAALKAVFREVLGQQDRDWPMIVVQPKRAARQYDDPVRRGQQHPLAPHRRVLDAIQVDDVWVYNTLVDQKEVEMSVLFPRNGRDAPHTIEGAFHLLRQLKASPSFRAIYTENGVKLAPKGESTTKHTEYRGRLLATDLTEEITRAERTREDVKREAEHHRAQRERMVKERAEVDRQMQRLMQDVKKMDVQLSELQQNLDEIERERRSLRREEDVVHLQAERDGLTAEVGELDAQLADAQVEVNKANVMRDEALERLRAADAAEGEAEGRVTEARRLVDAFTSSRAELRASIEAKTQKLRSLSERQAKVSQNVQAESAALAEEETALLADHGQVSVDHVQRSRDAYTREVKKAEVRLQDVINKIQAMARKGGRGGAAKDVDIDRMALQFEQQRRACEELRVRLQRLEGDSKWLSAAMSKRQAKWKEYRQRLGERLQVMYQLYLSKSNKKGVILLDHDHELLDIPRAQDISVKDEDAADSGQLRHSQRAQQQHTSSSSSPSSSASSSSKTMSGGEKSIITVAFLMSLWRSVDCPWRAMDEFDVFQDSINRATSMELLIQGAAHTPSRQFLFLTPLDVAGVLRPGVSVKEMPRVDDAQKTLPFRAHSS